MGEKTISYDRLKQGGFLRQRQKEDFFSIRLRIVGGQLTAEQLRALADASEKYGRGEVHITARQGMEISYIPFEDADAVLDELEARGVRQGTCGPRVRGVVACQGNRICPRGLIDAGDIARKIDDRYFAMELPGKFKFGVTGCPSSCIKAQENDLGVMGGLEPEWVRINVPIVSSVRLHVLPMPSVLKVRPCTTTGINVSCVVSAVLSVQRAHGQCRKKGIPSTSVARLADIQDLVSSLLNL